MAKTSHDHLPWLFFRWFNFWVNTVSKHKKFLKALWINCFTNCRLGQMPWTQRKSKNILILWSIFHLEDRTSAFGNLQTCQVKQSNWFPEKCFEQEWFYLSNLVVLSAGRENVRYGSTNQTTSSNVCMHVVRIKKVLFLPWTLWHLTATAEPSMLVSAETVRQE